MEREAITGVSETRDEAQIIASILAGNTHAFHDLIRPHEHSVYIMALSLLHNEADAEDAAQEAFLKAFRNLANFRGEAKFGTWLISITLNEARSRLRARKTAKIESLDEPPEGQGQVSPALLRDWREIPSEALERKEVRLLLQQAVADLPLIYREVFLLRDVEELSINESAEALGITIASVKVRLHRARIMLQKRLVPQLKRFNPKRRWFSWS
jgi:RNA polymerase sigma-70 factor (ECF subfamily)